LFTFLDTFYGKGDRENYYINVTNGWATFWATLKRPWAIFLQKKTSGHRG
jgi:hypothetical protein